MITTKTKLKNVLVIQPPTVFEDYRGIYLETFNEKLYADIGIPIKFIQDDFSISHKNVLRGIHGDNQTWKLITCILGSIYAVVVNCNTDSTDYGSWESFKISEKNNLQILVPPKHGLAHLILTDKAIFHYKQSSYYNREAQFTYKWDDPRFNIRWPIDKPILSQRDEMQE